MTEADDPLVGHLRGEVARIERSVDDRLSWPAGSVIGTVDGASQTIRWTYRFTWQEVERGRRYVIPLSSDGALTARRPALAELRALLERTSQIVARNEPVIRYRAGLNAYEVSCSLRVAAAASDP